MAGEEVQEMPTSDKKNVSVVWFFILLMVVTLVWLLLHLI